MDAHLLGGCIHEASEPISPGNTTNKLRSVDSTTSDQEDGCCHFSIRGYVASVRKSDRNGCWPFCSIHSKCNPEKDENALPPIAVAEFRWWNCKNCLLNDCNRETDRSRESLSKEDEGTKFLPNVNADIDDDASIQDHLVVPPMIRSTVPLPEAMPSEEYCKSPEHYPLADTIDEDSIVYNLEKKVPKHSLPAHERMLNEEREAGEEHDFHMHDRLNGLNGNHSLSKLPVSQAEDGDGNTYIELNTIPKDTGMACNQVSEGNSVGEGQNVSGDNEKHSTDPIASSMENTAPKSDVVEELKPCSRGCDQKDSGATTNSDGIIESEDDDEHVDPRGNGNGTLNQRRVRRTRMLSDIMESEVSIISKPIPKISRAISVNSEDDALRVDAKGKGKIGETMEEVKSIWRKNNRPSMNTGVFGDELILINAENCGNANDSKDKPKNTGKKHVKSRAISAISEVEDIRTTVMVPDKLGDVREVVKHKNMKHKQVKVVPAISEDESTPTDENGGKKGNLKEESKHAGKKYRFLSQENGKKKKHWKRSELLETVDEGSSLIDWIKRSSKKVEASKQDLYSRCQNSMDSHSDSPGMDSNENPSFRKKDPYFLEDNVEENKNSRQIPLAGKKSFLQLTSKTNDISSSKDGFKDIPSGNHLPSKKLSVTNDCSIPKPSCLAGQNRTGIVSKSQGEENQANDSGNLPIFKQKESDNMVGNQIIDIGGCNKVSNKRIAREEEHKADTASADEIEIYKFLQEGWHKRHSVKAGDAPTSKEVENQKGSEGVDLPSREAPTEPRRQQQYPVHSANCYSIGTQVSAIPNDLQRMLPQSTLGDQHQRIERRPKNASYENEGSGNCRHLINLNRHFNASNGLLESLNYRKPFEYGSTNSISINRNGCLQDLNEHWLMAKEKDFGERCRLPSLNTDGFSYNRQTTTPMGTISFEYGDFQTPNIQTDAKVKETPVGSANKRKRSTEETEYAKTADETFGRVKKRKQVGTPAGVMPSLEARKEYNTDMVRPMDLGTNETISALNLLKLIDPAVCSSTHVCADKNSCKFSMQSNFTNNYVPKGSFEASVRNRNDAENKNPFAGENVKWHCRSRSLNLYNPAPRIGVAVPFYLKNDGIIPRNHDTRMLFLPSAGSGNGETCSYLQNNNSIPTNISICQGRVSPYCSFFNNGNQEAVTLCHQNQTSLPRGDVSRAGTRDNVEAVQSQKRSCSMGPCVVNMNPADFTIPGEDNEYMTGYEDLQSGQSSLHEEREFLVCPHVRQKRRAQSLIATKGLLRS